MGAPSNVAALSEELAQAIEITMNPKATQEQRTNAYFACERFKEVSPLCAQAGLYLATGQYSGHVRHFGLQLMEYTVKFNWNNISQEEKLFIKENTMKLLQAGVGLAQDQSASHLKDALSRIIVEMIKREWPQHWTPLLSELSDACSKGEAQTELVLLVFLRLVEDVALLQTLESNQRRKDIYQALTTNMSEIFEFFLRLIELHVSEFRRCTGIGDTVNASAHSRVVQVALLTLSGFVEWVSIVHIMASNGRLLHILCILLSDAEFQLPAAECLLQIVSRRGQIKDRKPLLLLFSEEAISFVFRAANQLDRMLDEAYYTFLKKLIQVLGGMCTQLTSLWGKEDTARPTHFHLYLDTILLFTNHASLTLTHSACLIWTQLLKHDQISKDPMFLDYVKKLIQLIGPKVIRLNYPTSRPRAISMTPQSFASLDYDSDDEFIVFFHRARTDFLEIFRQATLIAPLVTFGYCQEWLAARLLKAITEVNTTCSVNDPVYLEWEALVAVLESVLNKILLVQERPSVAVGLRLLESCLNIETQDPIIMSILLSCISSLFVFLSMSSCQMNASNSIAMTGAALLSRVLDKIFAALVFNDSTDPKSVRSRAVNNLRRHSASLMVKIAYKYPLLLLPIFDQISLTVQNLARQTDQLTNLELITLQEALLLISNHFCDYERQSGFVMEVIRPASTQWMTLSAVLKTPKSFVEFVGLHRNPVDPPIDDAYSLNRSQLMHALNLVLGVIKRCSWPDDPDRAARGGFVVGHTESGNPICRNPATQHVVPLLPHILSLFRVMNQLFAPEATFAISEGFKKANEMLEHEKRALVGGTPVISDPLDPAPQPSSALDRMQKFITAVFENCYHMLGAAGPSLGRDLYSLQGITEALIENIFSTMEHVPAYRLRPIIRVFLKPFTYSCPPAYYDSVLLPIYAHVAPFMLERLTTRWQYITNLYKTGELGEDVTDTQEVLEDMLNRSLTREYVDILKVALIGGSMTSVEAHGSGGVDMDINDEQSMDGTPPPLTRAAQSAMTSEVISELGGKLLRYPYTYTPILCTVLKVLSWNDSTASLKTTYVVGPIIRFLVAENLVTSDLAVHILTAVLHGLQEHGQHEANQATLITLGVQVYEILRPKFPSVFAVLQQIPNINIADIQKLDEKISASSTKGNKIDKAKKDLFKKITAQLVGRNVGQWGRNEVKLLELPPLNLPSRNAGFIGLIDASKTDPGLAKLFAAEEGGPVATTNS